MSTEVLSRAVRITGEPNPAALKLLSALSDIPGVEVEEASQTTSFARTACAVCETEIARFMAIHHPHIPGNLCTACNTAAAQLEQAMNAGNREAWAEFWRLLPNLVRERRGGGEIPEFIRVSFESS